MNMGFPGCLLLRARHPLGRSSAACTGAGNTRIPILLAWLWASMTGLPMADPAIPELTQLRLVNSPSGCAGRVEVLHNQQWGTVCDDGWDIKDATVVCKQLGCGTALSAPRGARFGRGSDRVWLDEVNCAGTEAALTNCEIRPWGQNDCTHKEDAGVVCSDSGISEVAQIRLVNSWSRCAGRVEVLPNHQWGTVCDDNWDLKDAEVVCRQLGCGTALSAPGGARFGPGSDHIWLDEVHCAGTEVALSNCRAQPWGDSNCNHGEDAGVVCSDAGISEVAQIRLVNSRSRCAGRVEVLRNQQWGTVCDNSWDLQDARVVCRQLGCGTALSAPGGARFGPGSDRIWLDDVNCTGTEVALSDCRAQPWGVNNCTHGEDAGVECSDAGISEVAQLRLVNSRSRCAGRVEVLHNHQWGTVCDDSWDPQDAGVVCRQLGCGTALSAPRGARFGQGSDHIWLNNVNCAGTEVALSDCRIWLGGDSNCNHGKDAGVVCSGSDISEVAELRLVNSRSRCAGRVEVLHNQQWGTVCNDNWDLQDAGVVCRQLGCGTALSAPGGVRFGQGSDHIWLDDINCTGTEAALSDCWARPWGDNNCTHRDDASVVCSDAGISEVTQLRLVNGPSRCAGRVEVFHNQQWGTVCDNSWELQDAGVVCRQLGCGTALSAPGGARFGRGSDHIWLDDVNCTGTEVALSDCRARPWGDSNCTHGEDAGVVCSDVRLVGGPHRCAGRVEVRLDGPWGTVCDDGWDLGDVAVVCRQLGCGPAMEALSSKVFGQGNESDPVLMMNVQCQGTEAALGSCPYEDPGDFCLHDEDAGARCQAANVGVSSSAPGVSPHSPGAGVSAALPVVRLVGGPHRCAGQVEVRLDGRWGTVCDDGWDLGDVAVVCRQLGCGQAMEALSGKVFGQGNEADPVLMMNVQCQGTEAALGNCSYMDPGDLCQHDEDAGARCQGASSEVRLVGGPHRCAGRVEVRPDRRWGTVCDNGWDMKDVAVVCRQLGCGPAMESLSSKVFGPGVKSDPVLMTKVQCQGTEAALGNCSYIDPGDLCQHDKDAGARCQDVRLVGGPHRCAGRVEVRLDGPWGTVCDDGWDLGDVAVVCRQLGCGPAMEALSSKVFGQGNESHPILMMNVQCQGTEAALGSCPYEDPGDLCQHDEDAGARCQAANVGVSSSAPGVSPRSPGAGVSAALPVVRLVGGPHRCAGRVEVRLDGHWGTVCDDGWDLGDVAVVCRQLGCGQAMEALSVKVFGQGNEADPVLMTNVQCQGTEAALGNCSYMDPGDLCQHDEDAGARCQGASSEVRLVGGPHRCAGRVEVRPDRRWGTVCDNGWDMKDVAVVCRQLGCGPAMESLSSKVFGPGVKSDPVLMTKVQCQGTEAALGNCSYMDPGDLCQHDKDAGARCQEPFSLRLVDGPGNCSGRLEVRYDGVWGTVCDDDWSETNAQVVCQELGCGPTKPLAPKLQDRPRFGQGTGKIWLDDIRCKGTEKTLQNCAHRYWGYHNCTHQEDISVVCQDN
ncbi:deleted in malignant brain tumors 1 protein-like [Mauremys mutica]|uniref:deleted in malignant brain tumors 1 protein-like n=1 Tax=Mauremys mutica TaxID=74926 RepID=UPI001D164DF2|nr:deleted in malignant brain tumors 1 protein-like [Mauremys mutica]